MNSKKGQMQGLGILLITFLTVLVGAILFLAISQQVGSSTQTGTLTNYVISAPINGGTYNLTGYKSLTGVTVTNHTDGVAIAAGNYTVTNNALKDGNLIVQIKLNSAEFQSVEWNVTGTVQATDYIDSSAARSMALLIPIFFALAIALVALVPTLRDEVLSMMSR